MKHGKPKMIYFLLIGYSRFLMFLVVPPVVMAYFKWSPWILDYPLLVFAMFFASLWRFGLLVPVVALVVVTSLCSYYVPRLLGLLLDFIDAKRHP